MFKQEGDAGSSRPRRRPDSAIIASNLRRRRVLERLKLRWRASPATAHALKPMMDLAADVAKQRRGDPVFDQDEIWRDLSESVSLGFFNREHRLYVITDRRRRLTSSEKHEADAWGDEGEDLRLAFLRQSWAPVATIAEWARHQRYALPIAWQGAERKTAAAQNVANQMRPAATTRNVSGLPSKRAKTEHAILACLQDRSRNEGEKLAVYDQRISAILKAGGTKASERLVRMVREGQTRNGRIGKSKSA